MKRFIAAIVLLLVVGSLYLRSHPDSIFAYLFFSLGVRIFEPSYTERRAGIVLLEGFVSYSTILELEGKLKAKEIHWRRVPEDIPDLNSSSRPPFSEHHIEIEDYRHLGFRGQLSLQFLNDRLRAVIFYPADFDGYSKAVETFEGITIEKPLSLVNQFWVQTKTGYRKMTVGKEWMDKKRGFVGWFDARFENEVNAWIMRYS